MRGFVGHSQKNAYWRIYTLVPLFVAGIAAAFIPSDEKIVVIVMLTFGAGVMTAAFANIKSYHFNMMFMTGNTKNAVLGWFDYNRSKKTEDRKKAVSFSLIVSDFIVGALLSAYLYRLFGYHGILVAPAVLAVVALLYTVLVYYEKLDTSDL